MNTLNEGESASLRKGEPHYHGSYSLLTKCFYLVSIVIYHAKRIRVGFGKAAEHATFFRWQHHKELSAPVPGPFPFAKS